MRDPNRIDIICNQLADAWHKVPDMRLPQLLCNIQSVEHNDCYYMGDNEFINQLTKWVNEVSNG